MHYFTVMKLFALGEPLRLLVDVRMGAHHHGQRAGQTLVLGLRQVVRLGEELLCLLPKPLDGLAKLKELPFGLAYQLHEDMALPPALAAKTPHDLCQLLLAALDAAPERGSLAVARCDDALDECESFF